MAKQKPTYDASRDSQKSVANTLSDSGSPPPPLLGDDSAASGPSIVSRPMPPPLETAVVLAKPPIADVTLSMPPLVDLSTSPGYAVRHVDLQLSPNDAMQLRRLTRSLQEANCRLQDPSRGNPHVRTPADAFRWFLQQLPVDGLA